MNIESALLKVQKNYFESHGIRTDIHYSEGKGALLVAKNAPLEPQNVLGSISEVFLLLMPDF
ncbi:hypothetical protein MKY96_32965 [Paenibacillus sp. FSL R7-0302]|uniref:hypothetical protein n=1 Tax=Paenibacillus sp. FSL R7-0302 TaxID=2921681 RepID=UPI0030FC30C4